jgi:ketosteroid isomerase-like protein
MRLLITLLAATTLAQSPDSAIRAARARSNRAIAAHDADATTAVMSDDYVSVSSGNTRNVGRDAARVSYAQIFSTRRGVIFVRTPKTITVNPAWGQAGESGTWTGKWSSADGSVRVGGIYFAKWNKTGGRWLLLAETFVQTSCSGTEYCNAPPAPAPK